MTDGRLRRRRNRGSRWSHRSGGGRLWHLGHIGSRRGLVTQIPNAEGESNGRRDRRDHGDRGVPGLPWPVGHASRDRKRHHVPAVLFEQFGLKARTERGIRRLGAERLGQPRGKAQQWIASRGRKRPISIEELVYFFGELVQLVGHCFGITPRPLQAAGANRSGRDGAAPSRRPRSAP